ncbi:MAG TPA: nuclear transport factor 2 family protein [Pyrinomonadaceae bacterium]|nr:nuclear transport factor 2 family protein [Pyrinomonadaceae bacterium]
MTRIFGIAVLLVAASALALGQTPEKQTKETKPAAEQVALSSAERELTQVVNNYIDALKSKDMTKLDRIWADDLTSTNARGDVLSKTQRVANIQSGADKFDSIEASDQKIRVYGDTGVVTSLATLKAQYSGQDASGQYRTTQVWVKRSGNWQLVALQMTRIAP